MTWRSQNHGRIESFVASDARCSSWKVRKALGGEKGPWRIYVNGNFKGRAENERLAMHKAGELADAGNIR